MWKKKKTIYTYIINKLYEEHNRANVNTKIHNKNAQTLKKD